MFYVYVIKSTRDNSEYMGYTENLRRRLKEHNEGRGGYTAPKAPYRLIYYEAYLSQSDAKNREKNLKRYAKGYQQLRKRIFDSSRKAS